MKPSWRAVAAAVSIFSLAAIAQADPGAIRPEFRISTGTKYSY